MDEQNKNLILATVLSFVVIMTWFVLFPPPEQPVDPNAPEATEQTSATDGLTTPTADTTGDAGATGADAGATEAAAIDIPRVAIDTPSLKGSLSLQGGRIDDLSLKNYLQTLRPGSEIVNLLQPVGSDAPYYALFGWAASTGVTPEDVPSADTIWQIESGDELTPGSPVNLVWDNGKGLVFKRQISIDQDYMFEVVQSVENTSNAEVSLAPYGVLARQGIPTDLKNFFILHEGAIRMVDSELTETDYDDLEPSSAQEKIAVAEAGWTGFTDHYWMTTLIPADNSNAKIRTFHNARRDIYQTDVTLSSQNVAPGQTVSVSTRLFAGAKEWEAIRTYQNEQGVGGFLDSIDWGWFFFLTKPIFWLLHELNVIIGNMGWSIIALTLIIKAVLLPLAYKSYVSMAKMKELQPEMEKIKERAGDDRQALQKEMMALYKKEKVNPASGCLPILLQIPIFFSASIRCCSSRSRCATRPGSAGSKILSAPDPSSILNLWGVFALGRTRAGIHQSFF